MEEDQEIVIDPNAFKTFIKKHRVAIAIVGTSVVWFYINRVALAQHEDFLREQGLYELFYDQDIIQEL